MSRADVRTVRGGEAAAWWEFVARPVGPRLAGQVRALVGYREHSPTPVARPVFPTGDLTLIVSFGPSIQVDGVYAAPARPVVGRRVTSFAAGLDTAPGVITYTGEQHGIEVKLHPAGASGVLGCPPGELSGQVVDLGRVS